MAKYLLFCSTYSPVPVASIIDIKIKENLEKGGNATNIAFWNWTPEQKSILESDIQKVIFTSYWSTGKTRTLFEKAKMLADKGDFVIFVLYQDPVYAPILLYGSLMNEIKASGLSNNLKLVMTNDLEDVLKEVHNRPKVHVFIDELTIGPLDCRNKLDCLIASVRPESYFWFAIGKRCITTSEVRPIFDSDSAQRSRQNSRNSENAIDWSFEEWLEEKKEEGFFLPKMAYALRNSKEVIEFDRSHKRFLSDKEPEDLHILPTKIWPLSGVSTPTNQTCGPKPQIVEHDPLKPLDEAILECCRKFPASNPIIVINASDNPIPLILTDAIKEARGRPQIQLLRSEKKSENVQKNVEKDTKKLEGQKPFTRGHRRAASMPTQDIVRSIAEIQICEKGDETNHSRDKMLASYQDSFQQWLSTEEKSEDIIVDVGYTGGFEWPSVLVITPKADFQQFVERNCIMRAMSRLVIFRTDFDFDELKSLELTEFRLERELTLPWTRRNSLQRTHFTNLIKKEGQKPFTKGHRRTSSAPVPFMFPKIDS